jgi:DNA polymerase-3 subunit chi
MSEILFYHLERRTLDDVLPELAEKTLARGWRAVIRADSAERAQAIDNLLWTWSEESFLPHAQLGEGDPDRQPVVITVEEGNANCAEVLFLVGGAMPISFEEEEANFARIVILFDGRDASQLSAARTAWTAARDAGREATYWKQSPGGKWEKQA